MSWMKTTLKSILENLPITRYLVDQLVFLLFRLAYFNSRGQQTFDLPNKHFKASLTTAAEVIQLDVYIHQEVLVGIQGLNRNILSTSIPSWPKPFFCIAQS